MAENNDDRAQLLFGPVQDYAIDYFDGASDITERDTFTEVASDFLANFMHLCDRSGAEDEDPEAVFIQVFGRALNTYRAQVADERALAAVPDRL